MIIIDTNVISESTKQSRSPAVVDWFDAQILDTLYFTATSLSELRLGIESMPQGKRKSVLNADLNALIKNIFGTRILPFDKEAALVYGTLVASARSAVRAISIPDGQIAAIAKVHDFIVATRDTAPFLTLGIQVINPFL